MCIIYVDISHLDAAQEKLASRANLEVDVFKVSTEHNDRAILEGTTRGDLDGMCILCTMWGPPVISWFINTSNYRL